MSTEWAEHIIDHIEHEDDYSGESDFSSYMLIEEYLEDFEKFDKYLLDYVITHIKDMIRTAANVRIDEESVLAYEVVRDTPDSYEKLLNKIERYYNLVNNEEYLASNFHGDTAYPQMIICGQSLEHNIKIAEYLRENGLWREEDPILFTEDLLNMKRSRVSIYALGEDNTQSWYTLPENKEFFRETA